MPITWPLLARCAWFACQAGLLLTALPGQASGADQAPARLRLAIETDAGGDPDDEQSLVRFLLYANEWDVEAIIANRPKSRDGENWNPERTGLGVVQRLLKAYGECQPNLAKHDPRFPTLESLWQRTLAGYDDKDHAMRHLVALVDKSDPRPLWYSDWGTDHGTATNNLKRALDLALRERGANGYAAFKQRLRLASSDRFGEHTLQLAPAFPLWVDTFRPEINRRRWYHRFSALTARAGGFDLQRDVLTGHGPLGAMYPTNTTHWQKEGDTMTFLYLVPTGMNDPGQPGWGSWAGRYGLNPTNAARRHYWANQEDTWRGVRHREQTLARWAEALQNDFRARLDWCVKDYSKANHPPTVQLPGPMQRVVRPGDQVVLDASASTDPDQHPLQFEWFFYPEAGGFTGDAPSLSSTNQPQAAFAVPTIRHGESLHLIVSVTDSGQPPLTRYRRVIFTAP